MDRYNAGAELTQLARVNSESSTSDTKSVVRGRALNSPGTMSLPMQTISPTIRQPPPGPKPTSAYVASGSLAYLEPAALIAASKRNNSPTRISDLSANGSASVDAGSASVTSQKRLQEMGKMRTEQLRRVAGEMSFRRRRQGGSHLVASRNVKAAIAAFSERQKDSASSQAVLHPDDIRVKGWNLLTLLLALVSIFFYPYVAAFRDDERLLLYATSPLPVTTESAGELVLFVLLDLFFIADFFARTRIGYFDDVNEISTAVLDPQKIWQHYRNSAWLYVDVISILPIEWLVYPFGHGGDDGRGREKMMTIWILRSRVLLRSSRFRYIKNFNIDYGQRSGIASLVELFFGAIVYVHLLACAWQAMAFDTNTAGQVTWAVEHGHPGTLPAYQYANNVYQAVLMIIGEDLSPETPGQALFLALLILMSSVATGVIYSVIYTITTTLDTTHEYSQKLKVVTEYMDSLQLEPKLRERILLYYNHCWNRFHTFEGVTLFEQELSPELVIDVRMHIHRDVLRSIPFIHDDDDTLMREIASRLVHHVVLPGSRVRADENLHLVSSGAMEIHELNSVSGLLETRLIPKGGFFGVEAILTGSRRHETVIAIIISDLASLSAADFKDCQDIFPAFRAEVSKYVEESRLKHYRKPKPSGPHPRERLASVLRLHGHASSTLVSGERWSRMESQLDRMERLVKSNRASILAMNGQPFVTREGFEMPSPQRSSSSFGNRTSPSLQRVGSSKAGTVVPSPKSSSS